MPWFSLLFQISFRVILVHDSRISISNLQSPSCLTALSSSSEVKVRKYQFSFPEIVTQWCQKQSRTLFNFLIFWAVASFSSKTLGPRFVSRHFWRHGQKMLSINPVNLVIWLICWLISRNYQTSNQTSLTSHNNSDFPVHYRLLGIELALTLFRLNMYVVKIVARLICTLTFLGCCLKSL